MNIVSFRITGKGYALKVKDDQGNVFEGETFWDMDGADKIFLNGFTWELIGLSYVRKIA